MINVQDVLRDVPHFETFCSVKKLHGLVDRLRADSRFEIRVAGTSVNEVPIHHVRFGNGSVKALLIGFPHSMEPIGGLTVFSLMTLLLQGCRALLDADVEWNIVPCVDPDGALLNEGWSQKPFTLDSYMKNFYLQPPGDQADCSFPIRHKKLVWNKPSKEAQILQAILDQVRPDFYFSLHNAPPVGGAFYYLNRDIDHKYHGEIYRLLENLDFPLQRRPVWREICPPFGEGIVETFDVRNYYDYLEQTALAPEELVQQGTCSWNYLAQIKPGALSFLAELGYVRHPSDESEKETGRNLRQFALRIDADSKYLATILLEEWEKVKGEVDTASPFYRAITGYGSLVLPEKERLCEGGQPLSWYSTRDILFNPQYNRPMKEADRFSACMVYGGFAFPRLSYQFVRLLKASPQTPAVLEAIDRVERAFDEALAELGRHVDFSAFEVVDCDTLAKVQLGSGLIVLNSLLEARTE